ncbi:FG-GAP-like repeat-containing protein [Agrilutibacter solisilvae]|uniref:VCBS repeat-containing protein n=1 Tax=Agrilutibacter solisilvae TaxID=2763317 RepID=A0A975AQN0_9GAMM|nr:FG-GAP-like repeat-containing protein [Lysobacter solisilvae]QSX77104.1 VCBS repeat-containing protein [Lysobacter solisilvae]
MAAAGLLAACAAAALVGTRADFRLLPGRQAESLAGNLATATPNPHDGKATLLAPGTITTIAGTGEMGDSGDGAAATLARMSFPYLIAVHAGGTVYFVDGVSARVRRVSPTGIITAFAGTGVEEFAPRGTVPTGDGGPATQARFGRISALATDLAGNVYIADDLNRRIRKVGTDGVIRTIAGTGDPQRLDHPATFAGEGGPALAATLSAPDRMTVDGAGNLFFHDHLYIRRISPNGTLATIAGNGDWQGGGGDGGPARQASLDAGGGLAVDAAGNLFVADINGSRVRCISPDGIIRTVAGGGSLADDAWALHVVLEPNNGLALDARGHVFTGSGTLVQRVNAEGILDTVVGRNVGETLPYGVAGYGGDNGPATLALINSSNDLGTDAAGNLYIADTGNHRIRKVTPSPVTPTPFGLGAFAPVVELPAGGLPREVQVADVNGDRRQDLLVIVDATPDVTTDAEELHVRVQQADGTLATATRYSGVPHGTSLLTGDFNRDGAQDLVLGTSTTLKLALGRSTGLLQWITLPRWSQGDMNPPVTVDSNADGLLDLCLVEAGTVVCHRGDGRGNFVPAGVMAGNVPVRGQRLRVGDFNGDGWSDLVTEESSWIGTQLSVNRAGLFSSTQYFDGGGPGAVGDWNSDGRADLLYRRYDSRTGQAVGYNLFPQTATGTIGTAIAVDNAQVAVTLAAADVQNDGLDDLLTVHDQGQGLGLMGQRDGVLQREVRFPMPPLSGT